MLTFLLRFFSKRFAEKMGEEWLMDTSLEQKEAKKKGHGAYALWVARTAYGVAHGALVTRFHETSRKKEYNLQLSTIGPLNSTGTTNIKNVTVNSFLSILIGYCLSSIFLALWADNLIGNFIQSINFSLLYTPALQIIFLVCGLFLLVKNNSNCCKLTMSLLLFLLVSLGCFSSYLSWNEKNYHYSIESLQRSLTEYRNIQEKIEPLIVSEERHISANLPEHAYRCSQANLEFSTAFNSFIKSAKNHDVFRHILFRNTSVGLWQSQCLSEQELFEYNFTSLKVATLPRHETNRLEISNFGSEKIFRKNALKNLAITRETFCRIQLLRNNFEGELGEGQFFCAAIPNAEKSVHEFGAYHLPQ